MMAIFKRKKKNPSIRVESVDNTEMSEILEGQLTARCHFCTAACRAPEDVLGVIQKAAEKITFAVCPRCVASVKRDRMLGLLNHIGRVARGEAGA